MSDQMEQNVKKTPKYMFWKRAEKADSTAFGQTAEKKESKTKQIIKSELFEVIDKAKNKRTIRNLLVICAVLFLFYWVVSPVITVVQVRYQLTGMKEQMKELQIENKVLEEELNKVNTHEHIEEIARKELGMVKGDENPVYINETKTERKEVNSRLKSNDKIGIYMKDWYEEMNEWFEKGKK